LRMEEREHLSWCLIAKCTAQSKESITLKLIEIYYYAAMIILACRLVYFVLVSHLLL
jgi:hypothetical protein